MNLTTNAIITDVKCCNTNVWIQLDCGKTFPSHYEFDTKTLSDYEKVSFLMKTTKSRNIEGLKGKSVRVIDTGAVKDSLIAIGSSIKNKFIDLKGSEFPVSEKRIYKRHKISSS